MSITQKLYNGKIVSVTSKTFRIAKNSITEGSAPAVGDTVVRVANETDEDRQGAIYMSASDSGSPFIDVIDGATSPDLGGKTVVRIGKLQGIVDDVIGALEGYGIYSSNAYFRGKFILHSTGKTIEQELSAIDGVLTSKISDGDLVSLINQRADQLILSAASIDLAGAVSFTSFSAALQNTINDKASGVDVSNAVNAIEIGCENLLDNSEAERVYDGAEYYTDYASVSVEPGQVYTLQAEAYIDDDASAAGCSLRLNNSTLSNLILFYNTGYERRTCTFTAPSGMTSFTLRVGHYPYGTAAGNMYLRKVKLEKGNKPSAYSRSEGDRQSYADAAVNTMANSLGSLAYDDAVALAKLDETIIVGGYIKSTLLDVETLVANEVMVGQRAKNLAIKSNEYYEYEGEYLFAAYDLVGGDIELNANYTAVFKVNVDSAEDNVQIMAYIGGYNHIMTTTNYVNNQIFTVTFQATSDNELDQIRFYLKDLDELGHPISNVDAYVSWCALYKGSSAPTSSEWTPSEVEAGGIVVVKDGKINADEIVSKNVKTSDSGGRVEIEDTNDTLTVYNDDDEKVLSVQKANVSAPGLAWGEHYSYVAVDASFSSPDRIPNDTNEDYDETLGSVTLPTITGFRAKIKVPPASFQFTCTTETSTGTVSIYCRDSMNVLRVATLAENLVGVNSGGSWSLDFASIAADIPNLYSSGDIVALEWVVVFHNFVGKTVTFDIDIDDNAELLTLEKTLEIGSNGYNRFSDSDNYTSDTDDGWFRMAGNFGLRVTEMFGIQKTNDGGSTWVELDQSFV